MFQIVHNSSHLSRDIIKVVHDVWKGGLLGEYFVLDAEVGVQDGGGDEVTSLQWRNYFFKSVYMQTHIVKSI